MRSPITAMTAGAQLGMSLRMTTNSDGNPGPETRRHWFVECQTTPRRDGAHVVDVEGFEKVSQRTVLTGGAVQQRHDAVWTVLLQVGKCRIDVSLGDVLVWRTFWRVGDATAERRDIVRVIAHPRGRELSGRHVTSGRARTTHPAGRDPGDDAEAVPKVHLKLGFDDHTTDAPLARPAWDRTTACWNTSSADVEGPDVGDQFATARGASRWRHTVGRRNGSKRMANGPPGASGIIACVN